MNASTLARLVLAAAPVAAPSMPAAAGPSAAGLAPPAPACQSVAVRPSDGVERPAHRPWSARRLLGLDLRTSLSAGSRSRRVEIHVLTPGGHVYQKLVATAPPTEPPTRGRSAWRRVATARLSVAGTQITQRGLYGRWSVVPYLEGSPEPCGPRSSFTLAP